MTRAVSRKGAAQAFMGKSRIYRDRGKILKTIRRPPEKHSLLGAIEGLSHIVF